MILKEEFEILKSVKKLMDTSNDNLIQEILFEFFINVSAND